MKRVIKMIALLHLILLYGFLSGLFSNSNPLPGSTLLQSSPEIPLNERSFFSESSLFNATPSENQVSGISLVPEPSLKDHVNDYTAHHRTAELFFASLFSEYIRYSGNISPGFPKTAIIFPFHSFW
jgi:hypothetical protein